MRKVVLITGGFDPIHSGHISYIQAARKLGDVLVVGLNSDAWLTRKKGNFFLPFSERATIMQSIKGIDLVLPQFNDDDGTSGAAIHLVEQKFPNSLIVFANGGDRNTHNIPELYNHPGVIFMFSVGGDVKQNSSSEVLRRWRT
jgi:D-beta-D-heptose 7-phosphate kinase/D-beta-D-heptose 1-phosphate adenosyltransferase